MNDTHSAASPRVSVAIPVYNGENFLAQAIQSHLNQSYEAFELLISDNASTDSTPEICEAYARQDKRIRYFRQTKNIGAANNFSRLFELARGDYFKWSSHDDVVSPHFLTSCLERFADDPGIVLCAAREIAIDADDKVLEGYMDKYPRLKNTSSISAYRRFRDMAYLNHGCFKIFGLIKSSALAKTPKIAAYIGADRVLLAELALMGRFSESPEPIYFRRHEQQYCAFDNDSERAHWYDPNTERKLSTNGKNFTEYCKAINRADLTTRQRLLCYWVMSQWSFKMRKRLYREAVSTVTGRR